MIAGARDPSSRSLLPLYLYAGSFVGVLVAAFGFAAIATAGLAYATGNELVYGALPPEARYRMSEQFDVRRAEDLLRGLTFGVLGLSFWLVHRLGRSRMRGDDQTALRRGYALLGAAVFGASTIVLLPPGIYKALSFWLLRFSDGYRQGVDVWLAGGVVSLVIWLLFLRLILDELPVGGAWQRARSGPGAPPDQAR